MTNVTSHWRVRADSHAPAASRPPGVRVPWRYAYEPDEIEWPCCTAELDRGEWTHDRSCPVAAAARRRTA